MTVRAPVLMHLLVLGAFWHGDLAAAVKATAVLMHLLALGAFWPPSGTRSPAYPLKGS